VTGHVGFDKAGELLCIEVRHVPIDFVTMRPDMKKFKAAIDKNTCMVNQVLSFGVDGSKIWGLIYQPLNW
jgi:glutamate/tyrosine decarboxylase-like PLP-dependent enzyme